MFLADRIKEDLKSALKSGDERKTGVLRMLSSELYNRGKEKQAKGKDATLTEEEAVDVLRKELKKRRDAIELFRRGGRSDLVGKEEKELEIIKSYLPDEAGEEEITAVVKEVLAAGANDFGSAMREAMKRLRGRADGKRIGEIVKQLLN